MSHACSCRRALGGSACGHDVPCAGREDRPDRRASLVTKIGGVDLAPTSRGHRTIFCEVMDLGRLAAADAGERCQLLGAIEDSPDVRRTLRDIRRRGPGHLRRGALDALAYLGGEAALDLADVRVVERLVRIRRRTDPIGPIMSCWTYWWTVRSADQEAVATALGLTDVRPVTYGLAASVVDILEHDSATERGLVYVGPSVNGWVPVVGPWCDAFGDRADDARAVVADLSRRFGEAHAFYFGAQGDGSGWHVVQDGTTIRTFYSEDLGMSSGEPLPIERAWLADRGLSGKPEEHPDEVWDVTEAGEVAATISLDVGWHHPVSADVRGLPILAAVPGAGRTALPAGMYEI
jgi:hypothetical protein